MMAIMDREEVLQGVKQCLIDCIRVTDDEISLNSKIIDDLGADSLDLLDIIFSIERHFKVKIQQGGIDSRAREGLSEEEYEINGRLQPKAVERLRTLLPEVPSKDITDGMHISQIPYLFTVETFVKIVEASLAQQD
jgi:acyl carrier protein